MSKIAKPKGTMFSMYGNGKITDAIPKVIISEEDKEALRKKKEKEDKEREEKNKLLEEKITLTQIMKFAEDLTPVEKAKVFDFTGEYAYIKVCRILLKETQDGMLESGLIVPEDSITKITNIVMILAEGTDYLYHKGIKPGDICVVTDAITKIKNNPKYEEILNSLNVRPPEKRFTQEDLMRTPPYISGLSEWSQYLFSPDKIKADPEAPLYYLVPSRFILAKFNLDKYI